MYVINIFLFFPAEMWFGIAFAVVVEIVPLQIRSTTIGLFLFVINNIGGNLPILVDPVAKAIGYRESLWIFFPGLYLISSIMFLITMFMMVPKSDDTAAVAPAPAPKATPQVDLGHVNTVFSEDL